MSDPPCWMEFGFVPFSCWFQFTVAVSIGRKVDRIDLRHGFSIFGHSLKLSNESRYTLGQLWGHQTSSDDQIVAESTTYRKLNSPRLHHSWSR